MAEMWDYWLYSMNAPFGRTRVPSPTNLKMCDRTKLNLDSTHELRGCAQTVRSSSKVCNPTFQLIGSPQSVFKNHPNMGRKVNERSCVRERTVFDLGKIQILAVRGMLGAGRQGCAAVQRGAHAALSAGFRLNRHNECMIEARMPVKS